MTRIVRVKGLNNVLHNLHLTTQQIIRKTKKGLQHAAEEAKRESISRTPIDSGNLVSAAFGGLGAPVKITSTGAMWTKVGYDDAIAPYAMAVHESPGTLKGVPRDNGNGLFWDYTGEPQFLHNAIVYSMPKMNAIIRTQLRL